MLYRRVPSPFEKYLNPSFEQINLTFLSLIEDDLYEKEKSFKFLILETKSITSILFLRIALEIINCKLDSVIDFSK